MTDCTRCDTPNPGKEYICSCCAIFPVCEACTETCEACDEARICSTCVEEFKMLGGPVICIDCSPSAAERGRASIVWPDVDEEIAVAFMAPFMAVPE